LRSAWRRNLPVLKALRPRGEFPLSKQSRLRYEAAITWDEAYALRFSGFSAVEREALQPDLGIRPSHHWRSEDSMPREPIERLLEVDRLNYLPEYILRKADLATMAHGLEARAPLLDHHFVESLSTLPRNTRFTNPAKVWLVQRCEPCQALGLIELKKRGFNPSVSAMLRRGLAERLEGLGSRLSGASSGQLSAEVLDDVVGTWRSEGAYSEQLLQLLILDESLRQLRTPSSFN